ncbi:MAG: lipoate--protein ligase family protein [Actinomycetia bacterium]|nr:lipoate--protein ligase family protein [Actinomycetes bacterium]
MTSTPLHVISGHLTGDAALDTATSRAILQLVSTGDLPETLQVGMPHRVVAFGKHDAISARFDQAVASSVRAGFDSTIRIAGGRAVVFHPGTVRFAWTLPDNDPAKNMRTRFERLANAVVGVLGRLDIDAQVGELPDEYCAGRYSVHLVDGGKVMGVGQRLTKHAAQIGGMIVVNDPHTINAVLEPIYGFLEIPFDPSQTGSVADATSVAPDIVAEYLVAAVAEDRRVHQVAPDTATARLARTLRSHHVPPVLA